MFFLSHWNDTCFKHLQNMWLVKGLNQDVSIRESLFAAAGCMFSVVKILPLGSPKLGYQFWGPQTWDILFGHTNDIKPFRRHSDM